MARLIFPSQMGEDGNILWSYIRLVPVCAVGASIAILLLQTFAESTLFSRFRTRSRVTSEADSVAAAVQVKSSRYPDVSRYKLARLGAVLSLSVLELYTLPSLDKLYRNGEGGLASIIALTSVYTVMLSVTSTFAPPHASKRVGIHLSTILLAIFATYAYRDIWPLMTFTLAPADEAEGKLLWIKVALAGFAGVAEPLFEPFAYVPVDSENPLQKPNPEQTASLISIAFFSFLDPTIAQAYRAPHLSAANLPPQCDFDYARHLIAEAYPALDPFSGASRERSLLWGFLWVCRRSILYQAVFIFATSLTRFASPIGTNRLLNYLETGGKDAVVRPWVWIVLLTLGPLLNDIVMQLVTYAATTSLVQLQAIITSLIFDHALRVRLVAEVSETGSASSPSESGSSSEPSGHQIAGSETASTGLNENAEESDMSESATESQVSASVTSAATLAAPNAASGKDEGGSTHAQSSDQPKDPKKSKTSEDKRNNLVGRLNNLVTNDLQNIAESADFQKTVLQIPLQTAMGIWFLYAILGWSSLVGFAVMILLVPVPAMLTKRLRGVQRQQMQATDARVQAVSEVMNVLRMIKFFGWESRVQENIAEKREKELQLIWKRKLLKMSVSIVNLLIPLVHMVVTFLIYTTVMKRTLSASIVFSSMTGFNILRSNLLRTTQMIPQVIQATVSVDRFAAFLRETELLDSYNDEDEEAPESTPPSRAHEGDIGFGRVTFSWSGKSSDGTLTPSKRTFRLRIEDDIVFKKGAYNLILGPTGSGKTSILMALLGEMHRTPSGPDSWCNLPRDGGIAYAAQESWVQNETIKANILFGEPYVEDRYKKVIYQCSLIRDLALFDAGDATEVGEKGITISGGQKARITLARAVYSSAAILLLDDVLAALDVHTARWIVEKCFKGDLLKGRTIILVTHNIALASPIADFVVSLGTDGRILSHGSVSDVLASDIRLQEELIHDEELLQQDTSEEVVGTVLPDHKSGKLVVAEEIAEGHVSYAAFKLLLENMGGRWPLLFWVAFLAANLLQDASDAASVWWLGWWARQYGNPTTEVTVVYYLAVYALFSSSVPGFFALGIVPYTLGSLRASRGIHSALINSLLGSTFRWLDMTPTSRVIARCTADIGAVDGSVTDNLQWVIELSSAMLAKMGAVILFAPIFLAPGILITAAGFYIGQVYMKAQLSVKREMSNAKSPVLGILGGAISGLTSIRAYGAQDAFKSEMLARIDRYTRVARTYWNLNRWIAIRIDLLGVIFTTGLAVYLVYGDASTTPSNTGFLLSMAVTFTDMILWWVRQINRFEVSGNSLERIQEYVAIEQEPQPSEGGAPPAYWPASGDLRVDNLSARYSLDGPQVLRDISFHIKSGQRIGVVGRTGSGKSSLTLSLLRCIYTEGAVYYDGIPTHSLNLDALRSNITFIPQVPELLSGTLRQNLDMFDEHDDATLNEALRSAGLFSLQSKSNENNLTLDSEIASGGGNLSVGQRQILALARAMVRQSKLLILDEATSAIDYETDAVIQESLKTALRSDVTVIIVAHRLPSVMGADKIMVLDGGRLVEFDSPAELLKKETSLLRALVDESADKDALYEMTKGSIGFV